MVQKAVTGNIQFIELKKINPLLSQQTVYFNFVGRQDSQINRCTRSAAKAQLHRALRTAQTGNEWGRRTNRTPTLNLYRSIYGEQTVMCQNFFDFIWGLYMNTNLIGYTKFLPWRISLVTPRFCCGSNSMVAVYLDPFLSAKGVACKTRCGTIKLFIVFICKWSSNVQFTYISGSVCKWCYSLSWPLCQLYYSLLWKLKVFTIQGLENCKP